MITKHYRDKDFDSAAIWSDNIDFPSHAHNEYVLSCNIKGNEELKLDDKVLIAPELTTTLYNPGQVQSGRGTEFIISIYLEQTAMQSFLKTDKQITFEKPIVDDVTLFQLFARVALGIFTNDDSRDIEEYVARIIRVTTERYANYEMPACPEPGDWRVGHIKQMLLSDLTAAPRLGALADEVDLGKVALIRMFTQATGNPPCQWHKMQRIAAARAMLKTGVPASAVAAEFGFYDQAHLIRNFRPAYGITPGRYAKF